MLEIKENLAHIQAKMNNAVKSAGRSMDDVILLGATKMVTTDRIQEAIDAGLAYIGENRVQELCDKYGHVHGASWHFIGHLQTNKVCKIIDKVALIHAVDSVHLLDEIDKQAKKRDIRAHVLLEINASGEETKFGMTKDEARALIEQNELRESVQIDGLMTIGPNTDDANRIHKCFFEMRTFFEKMQAESYQNTEMKFLSMGMSNDYCIALEEGSNIVRIGSAIFGHREYGGKKNG